MNPKDTLSAIHLGNDTSVTVFHVVGTTQWFGTCRMHLYRDCHQLQKRRVRRHTWGDAVLTGVVEEAVYPASVIGERQVCRICLRRATP